MKLASLNQSKVLMMLLFAALALNMSWQTEIAVGVTLHESTEASLSSVNLDGVAATKREKVGDDITGKIDVSKNGTNDFDLTIRRYKEGEDSERHVFELRPTDTEANVCPQFCTFEESVLKGQSVRGIDYNGSSEAIIKLAEVLGRDYDKKIKKHTKEREAFDKEITQCNIEQDTDFSDFKDSKSKKAFRLSGVDKLQCKYDELQEMDSDDKRFKKFITDLKNGLKDYMYDKDPEKREMALSMASEFNLEFFDRSSLSRSMNRELNELNLSLKGNMYFSNRLYSILPDYAEAKYDYNSIDGQTNPTGKFQAGQYLSQLDNQMFSVMNSINGYNPSLKNELLNTYNKAYHNPGSFVEGDFGFAFGHGGDYTLPVLEGDRSSWDRDQFGYSYTQGNGNRPLPRGARVYQRGGQFQLNDFNTSNQPLGSYSDFSFRNNQNNIRPNFSNSLNGTGTYDGNYFKGNQQGISTQQGFQTTQPLRPYNGSRPRG